MPSAPAASVAQSFASQKLCGFSRVIIRLVSRLRRIVLSDHYFFVTCCLLRGRRFLAEDEFRILSRVVGERRKVHGFVLTAWVLLPDHWHAVVYPRHPLTISDVVEAIKVSATRRMNVGRETLGPLFQSRFRSLRSGQVYDRALRTVEEYGKSVEYLHWNPVRRGYVGRPGFWRWSSAKEYAGTQPGRATAHLRADD